MTEAERIDFLIKVLEGNNASEFAKKIGTNKSIVSRIRNPKYPNRLKPYISRILESYPSVNREWLETGEGYPGDLTIALVREHYEAKLRRSDIIIDHLTRRIDELEKRLGS